MAMTGSEGRAGDAFASRTVDVIEPTQSDTARNLKRSGASSVWKTLNVKHCIRRSTVRNTQRAIERAES